MNSLPDTLDQLALRVADGEAVDWDRALDADGRPAELAALRLIEAIAAGHLGEVDQDEES